MEKVKPETKIKGVYIVQTWGIHREHFYRLRDAVEFVRNEEKQYSGKSELYQIYKGDIEIKNVVQKNFKRKA